MCLPLNWWIEAQLPLRERVRTNDNELTQALTERACCVSALICYYLTMPKYNWGV